MQVHHQAAELVEAGLFDALSDRLDVHAVKRASLLVEVHAKVIHLVSPQRIR